MEKMLNKITLGDSLEILKTLPDKSIDFILTDPPYFSQTMLKKRSKNCIDSIADYSNKLEKIRSEIKPKDWFKEAIRVQKKVNMIIWLDDRHQLLDYLLEIQKYNLKYYVLNWIKINPVPINNLYLKDHEMALYIFKDKATNYLNNIKDGDKSTFYTSSIGHDLPWHPTPKPLHIIEKQILKHSKEQDIVLDLFSGSGTTAVACKKNNRQFIAIEKDLYFYKKSVIRLDAHQKQYKFIF